MDTNLIITIGISTAVAIGVSIGSYFVLQNNSEKASACCVKQYEKLQRRIDKLRVELEKPVVTINSK